MDVKKFVSLLFPSGFAWRRDGNLTLFINVFARWFKPILTKSRQILQERLPSTATDTLDEWADMIGIKLDSTLPLKEKQDKLNALFTVLPEENIDYLNSQIQKEFSDVKVVRLVVSGNNRLPHLRCGKARCQGLTSFGVGNSPSYYLVYGFIDHHKINDLMLLLDRLIPRHLNPVFRLNQEGYNG